MIGIHPLVILPAGVDLATFQGVSGAGGAGRIIGIYTAGISPVGIELATFAGVRTARTVGGRRTRRQRKPVVIEIDGEDIVVETVEEAEELALKIRAEAQELADQALQRAAAVQRRPRRKVLQDARKTLVLPSIEVDGDALMADLMRVAISDVKSLFESTMKAIEIGALMRQREQQLEEDDEDVLMLLL